MQAWVPAADPPGIVPDLHRAAYNLPPPPIAPLSSEDTLSFLDVLITELLMVCGIARTRTFHEALSLVEHLSRTCSVPISRGVVFMMLSPEGMQDEDELPKWAPSSRQFVESIGIPWAQMSLVCFPCKCFTSSTRDFDSVHPQ
jgi:hypothetical protein